MAGRQTETMYEDNDVLGQVLERAQEADGRAASTL
jgi:hypothetical protein